MCVSVWSSGDIERGSKHKGEEVVVFVSFLIINPPSFNEPRKELRAFARFPCLFPILKIGGCKKYDGRHTSP